MKPENDKELHNDLNISALPHPIAEGKEKDYTYSLHLAKLLRRFVRLAAPDYDQITLSDVELLDALMSYGTIEKVARLKGRSETTIGCHVRRLLNQLEERVSRWELASEQEQVAIIEQKVREARQQREALMKQLSALTDENITLSRRQAIASARNKSMAVEAHLREHKHN